MNIEKVETAISRRLSFLKDKSDMSEALPCALSTLASFVVTMVCNELDGRHAQTQQFGRRSQIAQRFGVSVQCVDKWMGLLVPQGRVRVARPPGAGWMLYNIPDIEKAMMEEAANRVS